MPTYRYQCINGECGEIFEVLQKMKDERVATCPECSTETRETVITGGVASFVKTRTVGALMDRNTDKMSEASRQEKTHELKQRKKKAREQMRIAAGKDPKPIIEAERPWWRPNSDQVDTSLAKLDEKQVKKYIAEGKK